MEIVYTERILYILYVITIWRLNSSQQSDLIDLSNTDILMIFSSIIFWIYFPWLNNSSNIFNKHLIYYSYFFFIYWWSIYSFNKIMNKIHKQILILESINLWCI